MEKYDVINVVGEGSYGIVMKCKHRESGQYVAIKKFLETEDDPTVRKMALREIRMLKKLRHENLVNMIEVFRRKKRFFLVFEYLEHTILEELESKSGGLGFITSRKYIFQILRALDFIHSHNVIHRDIKPENVLVSRLGVIKLCDFGFARLYAENETFTDYVATRWYRSPELLVGDPRYGKEVDIWAVGCLYAEMITGEPLFPGESDIDQLFQIIRVLGKLNPKHQLLLTQNSMFKGMKQEQNTTLYELFPDWDNDSLDFLQQCLNMNTIERSNTKKLLKHNLFIKDNFTENFLIELQTKINQETQINPLLKRLNFHCDTSNKNSEERLKSITVASTTTQSTTTTATVSNVNSTSVSVTTTIPVTTKFSESLSSIKTGGNINPKERSSQISLTLNAHRPSYGTEEQLAPIRHYLTNAATLAAQSKQQQQQQSIKQISINNLVFQDNPSKNKNKKFSRILSAKLQKSNQLDKLNNLSLSNQYQHHHDTPSSPVPFQSLQPDINNHHYTLSPNFLNNHELTMQGKRLSPANSNNNNNTVLSSITGQYFNQRRNSNVLNIQQFSGLNQKGNKNYLQNSQNQLKSNLPKATSRTLNILDNLFPIATTTTTITTTSTITNETSTDNSTIIKDTSPRLLPTPTWLISTSNNTNNSKTNISSSITAASQIPSVIIATVANNKNSMASNNKKNLTDWKNIARDSNLNDFLSPNCPGISTTTTKPTSSIMATSPYKGNKKKLSPMLITTPTTSTIITTSSITKTTSFPEKVTEIIPKLITPITSQIITSQNFLASSEQENNN